MTLTEIQRLNGSNEVPENDKADLANSLSKIECDIIKSVEDSRHEIEMVRSVHRSKVACVIAHLQLKLEMENIIVERDVIADTLAEEVRRAAQLQLLVDGVDSVSKDRVQFPLHAYTSV
jgi:hypothetical protein